MYKTIEGIMEKGLIYSLDGKLPSGQTRVLITVLGPANKNSRGSRLSALLSKKGALKLEGDPVKIQRRMRDAW